MSIDPKLVGFTADVLEIFLYNIFARRRTPTSTTKHPAKISENADNA